MKRRETIGKTCMVFVRPISVRARGAALAANWSTDDATMCFVRTIAELQDGGVIDAANTAGKDITLRVNDVYTIELWDMGAHPHPKRLKTHRFAKQVSAAA